MNDDIRKNIIKKYHTDMFFVVTDKSKDTFNNEEKPIDYYLQVVLDEDEVTDTLTICNFLELGKEIPAIQKINVSDVNVYYKLSLTSVLELFYCIENLSTNSLMMGKFYDRIFRIHQRIPHYIVEVLDLKDRFINEYNGLKEINKHIISVIIAECEKHFTRYNRIS